MHKSVALALVSALTLSTAAFAQTMIGEQEIRDADLPAITQYCIDLTTDDAVSADDAAIDAPAEVDQRADDGMPDEMATVGAMAADPEDQPQLEINLGEITPQDCAAAGLAQ